MVWYGMVWYSSQSMAHEEEEGCNDELFIACSLPLTLQPAPPGGVQAAGHVHVSCLRLGPEPGALREAHTEAEVEDEDVEEGGLLG